MRTLRPMLTVALLGVAFLLATASGWDDGGSRTEEIVVQIRVDETWVVENLYDGQTNVPTNLTIRLTVGERDVDPDSVSQLRGAATGIRLVNLHTSRGVLFRANVFWDRMEIVPTTALEPDTDYRLEVGSVMQVLNSIRVGPGPIHFSTRAGPQVIGLWRNGETLIIEFSEDMAADTLYLGHDSVDVLWEENGEIRSIAGHHNLAGYTWDAQGTLFRVAPLGDTADIGYVWVKVAADVLGVSGASLDGDADGSPGEVADDWFEEIVPLGLPQCFARDDIPHPCIEEDDIPDLEGWL